MIFSLLLCSAIIFTYSSSDAWAEVTPGEAKELYHQYCSVCHGDRGDGKSRARQGLTPPPRDFTAPDTAELLPRERIVDSILNGRPGTAMVGWKTRLSSEQAQSIADYIRTNFMHAPAPAHPRAQARPAATIPEQSARNLPPGNATKGQVLYMANCSTCHGVQGNGNGPRAYFIFPRPRDFTSQEARSKLDPVTLFHAVKNGVQGKEMPAWGKVFTDQQIADVSSFVSKTFLRGPTTR
jgi:cytochrome c oxidase cbb3-type subunit III